jgi:UDP-GlcNAc:undecaprenyl-phosphate GlcNAc-1-phosphate transferase
MPFVTALAIALVATPLAGALGRRAGLVDRPTPDPLKVHTRPVPFTGGLAVVAATAAALAIAGWGERGALAAGTLAALALGLVDDARPLPPLLRLGLQAGIGALIGWAIPLDPFGPAGGVATALIVVATVNAMNLLDGQDGLAGGVAAIAAATLALAIDVGGGTGGVDLGLALAGGLAGFVAWNRPPARIFLGDGGAYAVGVLLASLAASAGARDGARGTLAAAACLAVPAVELCLTVARRIRSGSRLVSGDRLHSYDRLTARVGVWRSTLAFWAAGAVAGGLGVAAASASLPAAVALSAAAVAAVAAAAGAASARSGRSTRSARVRQSR